MKTTKSKYQVEANKHVLALKEATLLLGNAVIRLRTALTDSTDPAHKVAASEQAFAILMSNTEGVGVLGPDGELPELIIDGRTRKASMLESFMLYIGNSLEYLGVDDREADTDGGEFEDIVEGTFHPNFGSEVTSIWQPLFEQIGQLRNADKRKQAILEHLKKEKKRLKLTNADLAMLAGGQYPDPPDEE